MHIFNQRYFTKEMLLKQTLSKCHIGGSTVKEANGGVCLCDMWCHSLDIQITA